MKASTIQDDVNGGNYYPDMDQIRKQIYNGIYSPYIIGENSINGKVSDALEKLRAKAKEVVNKVVNTGKTVLLSPARIAFLGLVTLNFHKLATHLGAAFKNQQNRNKIYDVWTKLGGNNAQLTTVVNSNMNKKGIFGIHDTPDTETINEVTVAAALAAAVPILLALMPLIKQFAPGAETDMTSLDDQANDALEQVGLDKELEKAGSTGGDSSGGSTAPKPTDNTPGAAAKDNMPLYLGLGVLAFLALKNN